VGQRVREVRVEGDRVIVVTDADTLRARRVVLSVGPWLPSLGAGLVVPGVRELCAKLVVLRQVQCWFEPPPATAPAAPAAPAADGLPAFIQFLDDGRAYYGIPAFGGDGVKVCRHGGGAPVASPDALDRRVHAADVDDVRGFLRGALPALAAQPLTRGAVCMYTMSPDGHFVVGALAEGKVVVLGGFSGHGFKMASAIGEIASELALDGKAALDVSLFDPARFG
jgi:sarcosine oxidase/N-methyl-L-tryptophan oxidase